MSHDNVPNNGIVPQDIIAKNRAAYDELEAELLAPIRKIHSATYAASIIIVADIMDANRKLIELVCGEVPLLFRVTAAEKAAKAADDLCTHLVAAHLLDEFKTSVINLCNARMKFEEGMIADLKKRFGTPE